MDSNALRPSLLSLSPPSPTRDVSSLKRPCCHIVGPQLSTFRDLGSSTGGVIIDAILAGILGTTCPPPLLGRVFSVSTRYVDEIEDWMKDKARRTEDNNKMILKTKMILKNQMRLKTQGAFMRI